MSSLLPHRLLLLASAILLLMLESASASPQASEPFENPWSEGRFALLQALALPIGEHPDTAPSALEAFGHRLFYDTALNPETGLACVSCHQPNKAFSDGLKHPADNPLKRNSPSLIGAGTRDWQTWDGSKDSLWSQALQPLYATFEIALSPPQLLKKLHSSPQYRALYERAFGPWPEPLPSASSSAGMRLQAQIGLAVEAFVRRLIYQPTPYDRYINALQQQNLSEANRWLSTQQQAGLQLLLRGNCITCHRGPHFSDGQFHNIGTGESDAGRARGKLLWQADSFNCKSATAKAIGRSCDAYSPSETEIPRLLNGAFKTPSLRELLHTAPYMHDGRFDTLEQVIEHYRHPPDTPHGLATMPSISDEEATQLVAFLKSLSSPVDLDAWTNKPPPK